MKKTTMCFLALVVAGCSSRSATVSGKVIYQGQKVASARVVFQSESGVFQTFTDADGNYKLEKVPPGLVTIAVDPPRAPPNLKLPIGGPPKDKMVPKDLKLPDEAKKVFQGLNAGPGLQIPDHFRDAAKSKLTYELKAGNQVHDIELK
jgi:hypothetical protein